MWVKEVENVYVEEFKFKVGEIKFGELWIYEFEGFLVEKCKVLVILDLVFNSILVICDILKKESDEVWGYIVYL